MQCLMQGSTLLPPAGACSCRQPAISRCSATPSISSPSRRVAAHRLSASHTGSSARQRVCSHAASEADAECQLCRRSSLLLAGAALLAAGLPSPAQAAKGPRGTDMSVAKDSNDAYQFEYPFGWQEVSVKGQDVAYKDIIEPLESVSVLLTPTDKKTIQEYGDLGEVAFTLANNVLTPQSQQVKILDLKEKDKNGRKYYVFEFAAKASTYIRHALAVVTVGNGQLYALTTGANEFRWAKMKNRVEDVVDSFEVFDRSSQLG